jgi:hypothetical protein
MNGIPQRRFPTKRRCCVLGLIVASLWLDWRSAEMHERAELRARILTSFNAARMTDGSGRLRTIDLRSADFTERDRRRAEWIFRDVHIQLTPPFYWDFFYRNPNPEQLRDPC